MNAVLSVQGASAPVKKKSFFSKFTRLNMLRPDESPNDFGKNH